MESQGFNLLNGLLHFRQGLARQPEAHSHRWILEIEPRRILARAFPEITVVCAENDASSWIKAKALPAPLESERKVNRAMKTVQTSARGGGLSALMPFNKVTKAV